MNDLRHDPDEGWHTVPEGEQPWGKTVRHVPQPDGTVLTQTNVPRPGKPTVYMPLYVDGNGELYVRHADGTISPLKPEPQREGTITVAATGDMRVNGFWRAVGSGADPRPQANDHDCTTWTERTERRIQALEDAVNRIADKLTYLLLKLDNDGK